MSGNMLFVHAGVPMELSRDDLEAWLHPDRADYESWSSRDAAGYPFFVGEREFHEAPGCPRIGLNVIHGHVMEAAIRRPRQAGPVPPGPAAHRLDHQRNRLGLDGCSMPSALGACVAGAEFQDGRYRIFAAPLRPGMSLIEEIELHSESV
jgi:hypothetical protein